MGTPTRERRLIGGVWQYVTVDQNGGGAGTTPDLAAVLAEGNDANAEQIKNAAEGTDPDDLATVSQLNAGSRSDVSDGGSIIVSQPDLIEFPNAIVDEPSPGVARVVTEGGSQPITVERLVYDQSGNSYSPTWKLVSTDGFDSVGVTPPLPDALSDPAWSEIHIHPDGLKFVGMYQPSGSTPGERIASCNFDGSGLLFLSDSGPVRSVPRWSPDGTQIAYNNGNDLVLLDADGSNPVTIVSGNLSGHIRWAPDGQSIVYAYKLGGGFGATELRVIAPDGTPIATAALAGAGNFVQLMDWSPDGTKIIFQRYDSGTFVGELYEVSPVGTGEAAITGWGSEFWGQTVFSPDGSQVVTNWYQSDYSNVFLSIYDPTSPPAAITDLVPIVTDSTLGIEYLGWQAVQQSALTRKAAPVADSSTVDQLRDALIVAGLVEA
jgi:Tol biopolymer transport system component